MDLFNTQWNYPNSVFVGAGRIKDVVQICQKHGIKAPLIITDAGLASLPMTVNLNILCREAGLSSGIFSNIETNPTGQHVKLGIQSYIAGHHDGVIAFGGGSAIDVAKTVALMVGQDRPLWDFVDIGDNWTRVNEARMATVIAIPTTAGTGSEMGRASVITDTDAHVKKIIFHPKMLPEFVILDPEVTVGLPAHITAATGIDALSHNLEALCSPFYHPMAEGIAIEGIRLVKEFLPRAVADGQDLEARMQMLVASSMGATAFQKGLGAMHALAHSLGALYGTHHGLLNAILMPYVLEANRSVIESKIERLSRYIGLENVTFDGFMSWVLELRKDLGIPHSLAEVGIDTQKAKQVSEMSVADAAASGNPIQFSESEYEALFIRAVGS
jgi:alcohol dehydrogenase class IV